MGKTGKTSFPWSGFIGPKPGNSKPSISVTLGLLIFPQVTIRMNFLNKLLFTVGAETNFACASADDVSGCVGSFGVSTCVCGDRDLCNKGQSPPMNCVNCVIVVLASFASMVSSFFNVKFCHSVSI